MKLLTLSAEEDGNGPQPGLRQLRRSGGHQPSSRSGCSIASLPETDVPPAIAALPRAAMPYTTCPHEQDGFVRAPPRTPPTLGPEADLQHAPRVGAARGRQGQDDSEGLDA